MKTPTYTPHILYLFYLPTQVVWVMHHQAQPWGLRNEVQAIPPSNQKKNVCSTLPFFLQVWQTVKRLCYLRHLEELMKTRVIVGRAMLRGHKEREEAVRNEGWRPKETTKRRPDIKKEYILTNGMRKKKSKDMPTNHFFRAAHTAKAVCLWRSSSARTWLSFC